jgi:hypothetical protein
MGAVDPHLERQKPLFEPISVGIVDPIVDPRSVKGNQASETIVGIHNA